MNNVKKKVNFKKILLIISIFIILIFVSIGGIIAYLYNKYDLDVDKLTKVNNGIRVYSSTGTDSTLYNTNRSIVELNELPDYVKQAFIDTEDKRFYSHNGYDVKRMLKAGLVNLSTNSKSQGASTISQQLVKNALLTNDKTYSRKIQEVILSSKMEKQFSKDEILEMYLNTIYFGSNAYGIENASKTYFNKSAKDLTINEACCLAGLIKSPNKYSPRLHYEDSIERRNVVARLMLTANDITKDIYEDIISSPIILSEGQETNNSYETEAIYEACRLLNLTERELINSDYELITFKNDDIQEKLKSINNSILSKKENPLDSVSIISDNNGKILAYYSNSQYNTHKMRRQAASTLKPLAVYLPCIIHNKLSPASQILDEEIDFSGYSPKNVDDKYHGYVSVRESISHSYNIPAVKALDCVGLKNSKDLLISLGFDIDNSDMNLSLALGATKKGVTLMQLVNAYACLANLGEYREMCFVDKIIDKQGKIIYEHEDFVQKLFKDEDCYLINNMLQDTAKTGTAKRMASLNLPIASKTGTASVGNESTDLYNIAYTSEHTLLTWVGDIKNNYLPKGVYSAVEPTEINKKMLDYIYSEYTPIDFAQPETIINAPYDICELNENHRLTKPNHNIDRYIAYDLFKVDNQPIEIIENDDSNLSVNINKTGSTVQFDSKKYKNYRLYKEIDNKKQLLSEISDRSGMIEILDNDIFQYHEIKYYLMDDSNNKSKEIKIRPKDYLINLLNSEIQSSKKRWSV